ncbi:MAG: IscA/HesB family protein [Desulfarculus sp.]|nr:IscA/HesB family protein [Desulfarculus sp.]
MIEVSATASQAIKAFMQERNLNASLRVMLQAGSCCGGPSLRLVLDEKKDGDQCHEVDGLTYLIAQDLAEQSGTVKVDYVDNGWQQGFVLSSAKPLAGDSGDSCGCGSSGGSCGSGGCGC